LWEAVTCIRVVYIERCAEIAPITEITGIADAGDRTIDLDVMIIADHHERTPRIEEPT